MEIEICLQLFKVSRGYSLDNLTSKMYYYNMKPDIETITVDELKTHFAEILKKVKDGLSFAIADRNNTQIIGYFLSASQFIKPKRKLGISEGIATVNFKAGFKMTAEELIR